MIPISNLFQSPLWENFQKLLGRKVLKIDEILFVLHTLPLRKSWLECPRVEHFTQTTLGKIFQLAKKENIIFLRIAPAVQTSQRNLQSIFAKTYSATASHFPEATIILDLSQPEDQILAQMKPKGRYNIKVAQRHGVTVRAAADGTLTEDLDAFYKILKKTATRDGFGINPKSHYQKMLESFGANHAKLFLAEHDKKPVAGLIATYFENTATYYYGASDHENRHLMAPYLLHFEVIKDAKKHGFQYYDLFGIAPQRSDETDSYDKTHPWAGVTEFKKKFGGTIVEYSKAFEVPLSPFWYCLYRLRH